MYVCMYLFIYFCESLDHLTLNPNLLLEMCRETVVLEIQDSTPSTIASHCALSYKLGVTQLIHLWLLASSEFSEFDFPWD